MAYCTCRSAFFDVIITRAHEPRGLPHDMASLDFGFKGLAGSLPH